MPHPNVPELIARATALVDAAKTAGADAADAIAVRQAAMSVHVRAGTTDEVTSADSRDLGLRVFVGKRTAVVSTSEDDLSRFPDIAERAVAMAKVAPEDPFATLADPDGFARDWPDLDLHDPSRPSAENLEQRARAADEMLRSTKGITNSEAGASLSLNAFALATSAGFADGFAGSRHGIFATAIAGEGTAMERDYDFSSSRHLADIEPAEAVAKRAAERALARLNARKAETMKGTVVFDPRVSGGLVGSLAGAVNGASIARGTSFLKDRMGEQIFSSAITITDDPLRPRGLASRPFDADGLATRPLTVVEDGVLKTWFLDLSTALEIGGKSTASAARSPSGSPSPTNTNLTLLPGTVSRRDLLRDVGTGLYVTELIGRGASIVTGDYSRGASGFWIEKGEIAYPVSEVTVAGNLKDMFRELVAADDLEYRFATNAPTVAIGGMTIAGR